MKQIYKLLSGFLLITCVIACYDDKGNYDYNWIQDIDLTDVLKDTTIKRGNVLHIAVDLQKEILDSENETESANPEAYAYEWLVLENGSTLTEDMVLSTEKDLNDTIWLAAGTYQVNYTVVEKASGIAWISYFDLTVVNDYTGGHIFLTEDAEQNVEMEIWANTTEDGQVHETGILARSGFPYTTGGANCVAYFASEYSIPQSVWIATGENTGFLNMPDFTWEETNTIGMYMLVQQEENYEVKNIVSLGSARVKIFFCASGDILAMHYNRNFLNTTFTYVDVVHFEADPYFGGNRYGSIFYDRTNKRIVSYEWASPAFGTVNASCYITSTESALEGYDLVCMQDRSNAVNTIVVVKDSEGNYYVCNYEIRDNNSGNSEGYIVDQYEIEGDLSTLENASYTAIERSNGFFYWAYNNQLYVSYHPSTNVSECVAVTLQDSEGNPITLTDEIVSLNAYNNDLYIATYSEENKGKVYLASSSSSDSRLLTVTETFETNNPVKSVTTW